ncbi:DUF4145 domain-containing protein [Sphingobacterium multivorum]|uniref:DUF4145 domain-containing protein n=1 Tax=Sphingobacterium multivorum TaxID=28454 RepID=UPI0028B1259B|nr:DUF4145 domain-containing protein [Sphingobacterium multivorum]
MKLVPIIYKATAANCPLCGAYSSFEWGNLAFSTNSRNKGTKYHSGLCSHCEDHTIWQRNFDDYQQDYFYKMIYPISGPVPLPNEDLPEDIKNDYLEASTIVDLSPRGSVALLRLGVQKLCKHLGEKGENINSDIRSLVSKGLNPMIQKALDAVRVTGNSAVHPGTIDLNDNREIAIKVFGLINVIADVMITQPKMIDQFYDETLTEGDKAAIDKRDNK